MNNDRQLKSLLIEVMNTNVSETFAQYYSTKIKKWAAVEFEKLIGDYRENANKNIKYPEYDEYISSGYNNAKDEIRQKIGEWVKK